VYGPVLKSNVMSAHVPNHVLVPFLHHIVNENFFLIKLFTFVLYI